MRHFLFLLGILALAGCDQVWNNPYPDADASANVLYSSFSERPKHLDPARSYASDEYSYIAQIYEPPLQYHFLKRPYQLVPLTAEALPKPKLYAEDGRLLPDDADPAQVAFSDYEIRIRPNIQYQPHPALAKDEAGQYLYHRLAASDLKGIHRLQDFAKTGSRTLTAEDYVYQIKRLAVPQNHSPIAGMLADYILGFDDFGKQVAAKAAELKAVSGLDQPFVDLRILPMSGVQVLDEFSYRIRVKGVYPQFRYWLAMLFFSPMPWEAEAFYLQPGMAERNLTLNWYPIGTGPYFLEENNPNLRMVLQRNPNFHGEAYPSEGEPEDETRGWLADAGKPLPLIERAVYNLEKENIPYWNKFLQGYYDVSGIASSSFDQAVQFNIQGEAGLTQAMRDKGIGLVTAVTTSVMYFGFNMKDALVGGEGEQARLLRRAISIALDYEEYVSIFTNGRGEVAQGILPPGVFGHRPGDFNPYVYEQKDGKLQRKPLSEAQRLMAEAGYANGIDKASGKPLVLYFDVAASGPDSRAQLNWLRKQFAKLGIQLILRATDYNRFQEKMRDGSGQMYWWGWNADYPDPENFFFLLYGPQGKVAHGGENTSNYANAEFDALFDRMKNMADGSERQAIIDQMNEIVRRDAPWIWGYYPKGFSLFHGWYANTKPNLMANNLLKYKRLNPELRAQKRLEWNKPKVWPLFILLGLVLLVLAVAWRAHRQRELSRAL